MNPNQIHSYLRRQPFRPLRIWLADGSSYAIRHSERALVTRSEVAIALENGEDELPERMIYCDPLHITCVEPLESSHSPDTQ